MRPVTCQMGLLISIALGFLLGAPWPLPAQAPATEPRFDVVRAESGALRLEAALPSSFKLLNENWRLQLEKQELAVGEVAESASKDSPVLISFVLDDKFSGQSLAGLTLVGGASPIKVPPLLVPAKLRVFVLLPADGQWKAEDLEFLTAFDVKIPISRVEGQRAELDLSGLTEIHLGDTAGLRSRSDRRRVTGVAQLPPSPLYPVLVGALAVALLVALAALARATQWKFWQTKVPPEGGEGDKEEGINDQEGHAHQRTEQAAALKEIQGSLDKIEGGVVTLVASLKEYFAPSSPPGESERTPQDSTLRRRPAPVVNGFKALAPTAEQFWMTQRRPTELAEFAKERGLQLFLWQDFLDSFQGSGIRTDDIRLQSWKAGSPGLLFLGWREGLNRPISLYPAQLSSFSTPEGRSVLQALFEFRPALAFGAPLAGLKPIRAAQIGVAGTHYKLVAQGAIEAASATSQGGETVGDARSPYQSPHQPLGDSPLFETGAARLAEITGSLAALQNTISQLGEARTEPALEARVRSTESQVGELLRLFKIHLDSNKVSGAPVPAAVVAATTPDSTRNPIVSTPTLARVPAADAAARLHGIVRLLTHPAPVVGSSEGDYLLALEALRQKARAADQSLPAGQFYRLAMNHPESASAIRIDFVDDPGAEYPRLLKPEGTYMTLEQAWQVFLGFEIDYLRLALVFPWSRLQKGSPTLTRDLVDATRSPSPLPEIVRCVQPLVLEHRPNDNAYAVVTKWQVAPIDAILLGGAS